MKIPQTIRFLYEQQRETNELLEQRVKTLFEGAKHPNWFYKGRIKTEESFAQKIETGVVEDPQRLEDFFACTLVVENRAAISEALELVDKYCEILYRRPENELETGKRPEAFPFDDLRLYVRLKSSEITPPTPLEQTTFEIQIKTFLQHAWAIATHDLVYKGTSVDWAQARVAFQIKAMLEHAEVSIEKVGEIASSAALALSDRETRRLQEILNWLNITWQEEQLPADRVRLAKTLSAMLNGLRLNVADMVAAVATDTELGKGTSTLNLSPYGAIVSAIANHRTDSLQSFLRKSKESWQLKRLLLIPEMEIPQTALEHANPDRLVTLPLSRESSDQTVLGDQDATA